MTDYKDVINQWEAIAHDDDAHMGAIHPAGDKALHPDPSGYWESGWEQAQDVAEYASRGARILDFGAGNGRLSIPLAKMGYDVYAADASPRMLERLKANAADNNVKINTIQSDGTGLVKKFGKKRVEVAVCRAVLIHHDYDGVAKIVGDIASVLKKSGTLITDWPVGSPQVRDSWIGVTVWDPQHRLKTAEEAGLVPLHPDADPSVWRKA